MGDERFNSFTTHHQLNGGAMSNLQQIFAAIAFAEENEHDTALNMLSRSTKRKENSMFKTLGKKYL